MQDPSEDTEWNDILRRFGIIPPKEEPPDESEGQPSGDEDGSEYERMGLAELEEAEDEFSEEDQRALESYRRRRLAEWRARAGGRRFGQLREIQGDQYVREVTAAGEHLWVVLHLYRPGIPVCTRLNHHLGRLAQRFPETKFLRIMADSCIPNYPDRHLPTVFLYRTGRIHASLIGEAQCGGRNMLEEDLEWILAAVGAVPAERPGPLREDAAAMLLSSILHSCSQGPGGSS
uniref:Phosducin like 2 n=1 Tax=Lepisosteus oculatus TaxID=7918 RepID=W5N9J6_LEPOC|nr:PREDICTED: phosducin-like protein 2 isoform X1 [Lepisosteus oculatus]